MLKGLLLCFSVLFVQLAVLHYFDLRIFNVEREEANVISLQDEERDQTG